MTALYCTLCRVVQGDTEIYDNINCGVVRGIQKYTTTTTIVDKGEWGSRWVNQFYKNIIKILFSLAFVRASFAQRKVGMGLRNSCSRIVLVRNWSNYLIVWLGSENCPKWAIVLLSWYLLYFVKFVKCSFIPVIYFWSDMKYNCKFIAWIAPHILQQCSCHLNYLLKLCSQICNLWTDL